EWDPTLDDARGASLRGAPAVVEYAVDRSVAWRDWLLEREPGLLVRDPEIDSPRGRITFRNLLASQRWHAAFHRQGAGIARGRRRQAVLRRGQRDGDGTAGRAGLQGAGEERHRRGDRRLAGAVGRLHLPARRKAAVLRGPPVTGPARLIPAAPAP